MEHLPSGLVTFLFTDIEGSTRLFRRLNEAYVELLERHNELLRDVWVIHRGVEVKTEGDAFFVAFDDAADAVRAAVAGQHSLASEAWASDAEVKVRMGLHTGLAFPRNGDYVAYSVHQAARVVAAAQGAQILATADTRNAVDEDTSKLFRSVGRYRLRDFDEPVELFTVPFTGAPTVVLPPRLVPAMGHNLPKATSSIVGRTKDLAGLERIVTPGQLVTIIGPGGVGKTRLATELGRRVAERWPDGVWLVDLTPLPAGSDVAGATAEAIGVSLATRDPIDAIIEDSAAKSFLIILDNCEHVAESAANLATRLLHAIPGSGITATSREPLHIAEERLLRLEPLPTGHEGVELFIERARSADPGFVADPETRATIASICERLDGIPLAIELAAARVDVLNPAAILVGLDDRFRFLRSRRRDRDERQRSLDALLDWGYELLDPIEQAVFRRMGVFAGSFTLDGAVQTAADDAVSAGNVVDGVWALVDRSLISVDPTAGETRYRMLETVREYAGLRLDEAHERSDVLNRLSSWYLQRFGLWNQFDPGRLGDLQTEANNIRGLVAGLDESNVETAQLLALTLAYMHEIIGTYPEGIPEIEALATRLRAPTISRAILLAAACRLYDRIGRLPRSEDLDEAESLVATLGPEPDWAAGTVGVARATWFERTGHRADAIELARRESARATGDEARARWFNRLGMLLSADRDLEGALDAYHVALEAEERLGNPIHTAIAHNNLAEEELRSGHDAAAARHQLHVLELAAEVGSQVLVAFSMIVAARVAGRFRDDWIAATRLHATAERMLDASGHALVGDDALLSERLLNDARLQLGGAYESHWTAGSAAELADSIDLARAVLTTATSD